MLDRSLDLVKFHPSTMSFRRKWVSDTNLSKLLHETIEKKQANKQSKLPDFCKDAILSATIKKISSAMVINRNLPYCGKDGHYMECEERNGIGTEDNSEEAFYDSDVLDKESWENDLDPPVTMNLDSFEINTDSLLDIDLAVGDESQNRTMWRTSRSPLPSESPCSSPKRKRQPSSEGTEGGLTYTNLDTVAPHASPCKKRRENFSKSQTSSIDMDNFDGITFPGTWAEDELSVSDMHLPNNHIKGQRSQSLPHLSMLISSKNNFPAKSVVNSISELSIHDWGPTKEGSWSFQKRENAEPDPLELNGFFQELKSVTVHPN